MTYLLTVELGSSVDEVKIVEVKYPFTISSWYWDHGPDQDEIPSIIVNNDKELDVAMMKLNSEHVDYWDILKEIPKLDTIDV